MADRARCRPAWVRLVPQANEFASWRPSAPGMIEHDKLYLIYRAEHREPAIARASVRGEGNVSWWATSGGYEAEDYDGVTHFAELDCIEPPIS